MPRPLVFTILDTMRCMEAWRLAQVDPEADSNCPGCGVTSDETCKPFCRYPYPARLAREQAKVRTA